MNLKLLSIKGISYITAKYIAKSRNENHAIKYLYYYSLQIIIGTLLESIILILISWLFGILVDFIACSIVLISIRLFAGGVHSSSYAKCVYTTILLMTGLSYMSRLAVYYYPISLHILLFIIVLYLTYKYAPSDTPNKPIISEEYRKKIKIKSLVVNILWFIVSILLIVMNRYTYFIPAIGLSSFLEALTLTPLINGRAPSNKCIAGGCTLK